MNPRGGYRPNSGRKPAQPGGRDIAFRLYPSDLETIAHAQKHWNCNRSMALREIIREWRALAGHKLAGRAAAGCVGRQSPVDSG